MEDCIFCQIIHREAPASVAYEDDTVIVFMDIQPVTPGHAMVIPKNHYAYLADVDVQTGMHLFKVTQQTAAAIRESGVRCEGVNLFLADGEAAFQDVFHVHMHVIPRFKGDSFKVSAGWDVKPPRHELDEIAAKICTAYERLWGSVGDGTMIVYPAIDLRGGRVVRLKKGDPEQQTIYRADPVVTAQRWRAAGANWLHVVNLDGALEQANANEAIVRQIARLEGVRVQFGGGLRDAGAVARAFDLGVSRVILGTAAVAEPDFAGRMVARWGADAVAVALDAKDGRVAVRGWQDTSEWTPAALGRELATRGVRYVLYTDVSRDGEGTGVNVAATARLARATQLDVVASGGVASLADVRAVKETVVIAGVVIGRALYEGAVDLVSALRIAREDA